MSLERVTEGRRSTMDIWWWRVGWGGTQVLNRKGERIKLAEPWVVQLSCSLCSCSLCFPIHPHTSKLHLEGCRTFPLPSSTVVCIPKLRVQVHSTCSGCSSTPVPYFFHTVLAKFALAAISRQRYFTCHLNFQLNILKKIVSPREDYQM